MHLSFSSNPSFTLPICGKLYRDSNSNPVMPVLLVPTKLYPNDLVNYPYWHVHTCESPDFRVIDEWSTKQSNDEWLCRDRRTILFSQHSKLRPTKYGLDKKHGELENRLEASLHWHCDHVSQWVDEQRVPYLLVEPYRDRFTTRELNQLHQAGLIAIEVPTNLSPYCGRWDPRIGTKPWTRSFLIADYLDQLRLKEIRKKLSAAVVPEWNDASDIQHYLTQSKKSRLCGTASTQSNTWKF